MLLVLHIFIAMLSIAHAAYVFFAPSKKQLCVSYVFIGMTLLSGGILTLLSPSHLGPACVSGFLYLGATYACLALARRKLAVAQTKN